MTIDELIREKKRLNKKIAPHFKGLPLINEVWKEYNEDTPLGALLRRKDKVCIQIHMKGNGYGKNKKGQKDGTSRNSEKNA